MIRIIDHVLAWLIDTITRCLGPLFPPTGTVSKDYRNQKLYGQEQPQNGKF